MVKWLEMLCYGAEGCSFKFRGRPVGDWKAFSVDLTVNGYFFRFRGGQDSERTGKGSNFYEQCQTHEWSLTALQLLRYKIPFLLTFMSCAKDTSGL